MRVNAGGPKERAAALTKLLSNTQPFACLKSDEIVPVKLTVGESQSAYHVGPEIVKALIAHLKARKARPFIFDTNVIYRGQRTNAVDHAILVNNKGFGCSKVGAPFIVADGLFGLDGKEYEVTTGNIARIRVPSFVGMLDSLVVLSHPTGHILSGYAGAIKNVAMGMSCRSTKQVQHSSVKPRIMREKCTACGCCIAICPASAISLEASKAVIRQEACLGCGECLCACKFDAVAVNWKEEAAVFYKRMVDVAGIILSEFKNKFFINCALDITKECDCISTKDDTIVCGDIGILASTDIVSVDKATLDLVNKSEDIFLKAQGNADYYAIFEYAAQRGLGSLQYDLKVIET